MKKLLYLSLALVISLSSCLAQSRDERRLAYFNKIKAGGSFDVFIKKGSEEKVVIEAQSGDIEKINTEVSGNTLKIYTEDSRWWRDLNFRGVKIYITFRELEEVAASGSGAVRVESPLVADNLYLSSSGSGSLYCLEELASRGNAKISNSGSGSCRIQSGISVQNETKVVNSGSGSISIEEINAEELAINNSGSGGLKINSGHVRHQSVVMSGSGSLRLGQASGTCDVRKSGSGSIHVNVREELTGASSGSGSVYLKGASARLDFNVSGSGKIRHVD